MQIIHSQLTTPDGTILISRHHHDYVSHTDSNGSYYFLDGGNNYIRCSGNATNLLTTLTTDDPHLLVRDYLQWGTYGVDGNQPRTYVTLANMETGHIQAVIPLLPADHSYLPYYQAELAYRNVPCSSSQTEPLK